MLFDFDDAECPIPPHAQVCILGAGAAGVALATELLAAGKSVVMLEGGGREQEARSQAVYDSEVVGRKHRGIHEGRFRTYGGTTTQWGGQILELQAEDFGERAWVPGSGWPFAKTELTRFYERSLMFAGLRRVQRDDKMVWQDLGVDPVELGPELCSIFSRWLPERNVAELHARALSESRRLKVFTHASATGFVMNVAGDAIDAVIVRGFSGRTARVTADAFVVCLGGIESTRLLLQPTAESRLPWQQNGLLGRHYQDHIGVNNIPVMGLKIPEAWRRFGYVTAEGFRFHNKLWLAPAEQERLKTLNVAGTLGAFAVDNPQRDEVMNKLRAMARSRRRPGAGEALGMLPDVAAIVAGRLDERWRGEGPKWKRVMLTVHSEQSPTGASAITLSSERDELGMLRARLQWEISDAELHTIRSYVRVATAAFRRKGLAEIAVPPGFFEDNELVRSMCGDSYHHMGGTVMSAQASDGIVDPELKFHGVRNGYVCAASVFPTGGFSNPTHTVMALAIRLADKLAGVPRASVETHVSQARHKLPSSVPVRKIVLPGSGARTSQLGFGCAYLLGPGLDAAKSRRLLDAAWDAGVRHYDAARLYGHGHTETLLGEFLERHPNATVTTKFGVVPASTAWRVAASAKRILPALGKVLPERKEKAVFRAKDAQTALETSLRALRRERVELFLLHEAHAEDLMHDDLLEWLMEKRAAGVIGDFGVGGEFANLPALVTLRPGYVPVVQFERSVAGPRINTGGAWCAQYRTFAPLARALRGLFDREPLLLEHWSRLVEAELAEPEVLGRLLLKASLEEFPGALTLFSTRSEAHIFANVEVAQDEALMGPAKGLVGLLKEKDWGLGKLLYGQLGG